MKEFVKRTLEIKIDGVVYNVRYPSVLSRANFDKKIKVADELDHIDITLDFLNGLGLPKEVAGELEVDHLMEIITELSVSSKKN